MIMLIYMPVIKRKKAAVFFKNLIYMIIVYVFEELDTDNTIPQVTKNKTKELLQDLRE